MNINNKKIINFLNIAPSKFRTKNWIEINDGSRGAYSAGIKLKLKLRCKSSLCDYNDAYVILSRTITVAELQAGGGNNNIEVVIKNCAPSILVA